MKLETKFLGEVDIQKDEIFTFEEGIAGFPKLKQYALIGLDAELPLALLQSVDEAQIGFIVALPFAFKKDYAFDLSENDLAQLKIQNEEQVVTYTIVTLNESFADSTINLLAPIVLNMQEKLGKQIILQDQERYALRFPLGVGKFEGSVK